MQAVRGLTFSSRTSSAAAALRYSHSKRVYSAISSAPHGSNNCWRGRSSAASVLSESSQPQRVRKRVSRDERKAMVKAFVDKYRASNEGKYPTTSEAQKQVGGSYYVVRNILQELVYNSKKSPTTTSKLDVTLSEEECLPFPEARMIPTSKKRSDLTYSIQSSERKDKTQIVVINNTEMDQATSSCLEGKDALDPKLPGDHSNPIETVSHHINLESKEVLSTEKCLSSSEAREVANSTDSGDLTYFAQSIEHKHDSQTIVISDIDTVETSISSFVVKEETSSSIEMSSLENSYDPKIIGEPSNSDKTHMRQINPESKETSEIGLQEQENNTKAATSDGSPELNVPKVVQEVVQQTSESDKLERSVPSRDAPEKKKEDDTSQDGSTMWGSLRSFADSLINLWRKM